jgi:hypothetical protein
MTKGNGSSFRGSFLCAIRLQIDDPALPVKSARSGGCLRGMRHSEFALKS